MRIIITISNLEYVDNYKYLGVWLDCKLSFQTHIKYLQSKIKSRIGFLFHNNASFTHAAKLTLVTLTILPILNFCDVIYKIASNALLSKLDAVYHSAIRYIFVTRPTGSRSSISLCSVKLRLISVHWSR